jgi:amino acid transporter
MTNQPPPAALAPPGAPGQLEPGAIGITQDTVIGMAASAPAASIGITLAALAAATAYGSGPVIFLTAVPMLIIANAYRRLNMWNANAGASFEWVGRAISPYLGFLTGWLMIAAYIIGTISAVEVLGPSVLSVFGDNATAVWPNIGIATALTLVLLVLAVAGIKITARAQIGMAAIEYVILIGFAVVGLAAVLGHHPGTYPASRGWLSLSGIGGHGSAPAGFLIAVYMYTGWDGTVYVNEETTRRRINPGRAAVLAVAILAVIYTFATVGLQGAVAPARLQKNSASALVYVAQALGGPGWAKVMALGLALSVVASTGAGIVLTARIIYGMARQRVLPAFLGQVSRRFATPVAASIVVGLLLVALTWVYLLAAAVQGSFNDVVAVTGVLFAVFYILTALATIVYYRRRVIASAWDALTLGLLPAGAAGFLGWIVYQSLGPAPAAELWSLAGVVITGVILMLAARFVLRSPFFGVRRESDGAGD